MKRYGLAFDIGTTTVTGGIVELVNKKELAVSQELNPQSKFGEDIISRLDYCIKHKTGLKQLRDAIIGCINLIIEKLLRQGGVKKSDIEKVVAVGNSAMEHFFLEVPAEKLAHAPYVSNLPKDVIESAACKVGLALEGETKIYLLPIVKSFVGSDLTAGVLYTRIFKPAPEGRRPAKEGARLLIDIGTNGEMALAKGGELFVASTAAGPAFESTDKGVSGSELIEIVSGLLKNGIIDKTGRLLKTHNAKITQKDIRKVQLAKAAIMAGMLALIKKAGVGLKDIKNLYVTGKFGNFINKEAAINIGLLPKIGLDKINFASNAAYKGAAMALYSEDAMKDSGEIVKKAVHLSLFGRKDFQEEFIRQMHF